MIWIIIAKKECYVKRKVITFLNPTLSIEIFIFNTH